MSRPKVKGKRPGGRNRQFFEGLSGLQNALNKVYTIPKVSTAGKKQRTEEEANARFVAAQEKRERKAGKLAGAPVEYVECWNCFARYAGPMLSCPMCHVEMKQ